MPTNRGFAANVQLQPPWYRQRWPWLLMVGPAWVLAAGAVVGYLAFSRPDAMVVDDYYAQGKAINQDLRRDQVALASRIGIDLVYEEDRQGKVVNAGDAGDAGDAPLARDAGDAGYAGYAGDAGASGRVGDAMSGVGKASKADMVDAAPVSSSAGAVGAVGNFGKVGKVGKVGKGETGGVVVRGEHAIIRGQVSAMGQALGGRLHLRLVHPTLPDKDIAMTVTADAGGTFTVPVPRLEPTRWQLQIEAEDRRWRLTKAWNSPSRSPRVQLGAATTHE